MGEKQSFFLGTMCFFGKTGLLLYSSEEAKYVLSLKHFYVKLLLRANFELDQSFILEVMAKLMFSLVPS